MQAESVVVVKHLQKSFGSKDVLCDVNFELHKGENLVVLGRSGSGKSVLIKCMVRLIEPDGGQIDILGKDVCDLSLTELNKVRTKIGFLFQSAALYDSMTVQENLEFPLKRLRHGISPGEIRSLVEEALENVGLKEALHKMPAELSGGMRKRVGLARTIVMKPEIMLYDEPTTGLDPITSGEISELILKLQEVLGVSSIIITHDIPCARITGNRLVILREGRYVAEGTFEQVNQSDDPWVKEYFESYRVKQ